MRFKPSAPPYISHPDSSRTFMINVIIVLLVLYGMPLFYFGIRVALLGITGVLTAVATEWLCVKLYGKKISIHDYSAIVTGLLLPLMLPATIPFAVIVVATIFAIAVAKQPFGGTGNNIFNPAAAGYAFLVTCFPRSVVFQYPLPLTQIPIFNTSAITLVDSPAFTMSIGGVPQYEVLDMLLGKMPGPMGATNTLVLMACLVFLIFQRIIRFQVPLAFLGTTSLIAFLFPRVEVGRIMSVAHESMVGLLFFGAIFMLSDPVTTPKRSWAIVAYSVVCGIIVMIFRNFGRVEETFIFAILIMNATVWMFDIGFEKLVKILRRRRFEAI